MQVSAQVLLSVGAILLIAIAADWIGRNSFLPRVTLLMIFGIVIGEQGLGLIPMVIVEQFESIAMIALLMVGFLIGGKLADDSMDGQLIRAMTIGLVTVLATFALVSLGLLLFGVEMEVAIILGCIATATAPAATLDVISESEFKGPFPGLLAAIVALDDAFGLILFSVVIAILAALTGNGASASPVLETLRETGGAILLGLLIGLPAAFLTGRLRPGQPMLLEALGLVFICGGLAIWLEVSYLIAAIVMGLVVGRLAKHHEYPFHEIEGVEWVFLIIFFTLAGATLSFEVLGAVGFLGIVYILLRFAGKVAGGWIGAFAGSTDTPTRNWIGFAMLPQAGVAVGMALAAAIVFPQHRQTLLTVVIASTIFFELVGPVFTRQALLRVQSARQDGIK